MDSLVKTVLVGVVSFLPLVIVVFIIVRQRRRRSSSTRLPFDELRRRPPGEALRIKLLELDERISENLGMLLLAPLLMTLEAWFLRSQSFWVLVPAILLVFGIAAAVGFRLIRVSEERENYRLGYDGERYVGEELTQLIAFGFQVYHDVPFKGFNIDHVLVGPTGVFAVETKTRRKPFGESAGKEYKFEFDADGLHWPSHERAETDALGQAALNAKTLSEWLTSAAGDPVEVTPILTYPGWWVKRKVRPNPVHVLNPKEIVTMCSSRKEKLAPDLFRRVYHQLEQKCKMGLD